MDKSTFPPHLISLGVQCGRRQVLGAHTVGGGGACTRWERDRCRTEEGGLDTQSLRCPTRAPREAGLRLCFGKSRGAAWRPQAWRLEPGAWSPVRESLGPCARKEKDVTEGSTVGEDGREGGQLSRPSAVAPA